MMPNPVAVTRARVANAARVFALATALGLATSGDNISSIAAAFVALCVVAVVVSVLAQGSAMQTTASVAEGVLVAFILVALGNEASPLTVYLVIPPFVAGLRVGGRWPAVAVAAELASATAALIAADEVDRLLPVLGRTGPWMIAGLGLGLLGSWMRASGSGAAAEQAGYESAHRLLAQLRAVSRHLSAGLDTQALAQEILQHSSEVSQAHRAVVLVRDEWAFRTLASIGQPFGEALELDSAVEECWVTGHVQRRLVDGFGGQHQRMVAPLRVGTRLIGVMVADSDETLVTSEMSHLRSYLDEHTLRLEAALLFDEVRSTATLEERSRLAREIHDGVAQEIASLGYLVDDLAVDTSTPAAQSVAAELRRELTRIVSELRLSIFDLRSNVNQHAGLGLVLSDYAREVGKRAGMTVHIALSEQPQRLHINVETELLRIAQEAITNARKHSKAKTLWVRLNTDSPIVMLRVEDDGVGSVEERHGHYGLRMMRERAERIDAELIITARPRGGTSVMVTASPQPFLTTRSNHDDLSTSR